MELVMLRIGNRIAIMSVSDCKQSISIAPKGLEVSKISIGLGKC